MYQSKHFTSNFSILTGTVICNSGSLDLSSLPGICTLGNVKAKCSWVCDFLLVSLTKMREENKQLGSSN